MSGRPSRRTPTEDLCLEVLAARYRLGERLWTFDARHKRALRALAQRGLVNLIHGVLEGTVRAGLTDAGLPECLDPAYAAPVHRPTCAASCCHSPGRIPCGGPSESEPAQT